jgi:glycosyltransferase involved in cell wall biosynthesis
MLRNWNSSDRSARRPEVHVSDTLHVGIDARMNGNHFHGAAMTTMALASELCGSTSGDEQYSVLTSDRDADLVRDACGDRANVLISNPTQLRSSWVSRLVNAVHGLRRAQAAVVRNVPGKIDVPESDGVVERAGVQVMHFTMQSAFRTSVPFIYQPHDLQHVHYPEYFSRQEIAWREKTYRTFCAEAAAVVVMTEWGKRDLIEKFSVAQEKVSVIPWAPLLERQRIPDSTTVEAIRRKYALGDEFALYPAQTWEHKNHVNLLRAIAQLKGRGIRALAVCTGLRNHYYEKIEQETRRLKIEDRVRFLDFVSADELATLYRMCKAVVFPSRFEGWGIPVTDAMYVGAPVVCSDIEVLREQIADAALTFDPEDIDAMAGAIARVWQDNGLRTELVRRGKQRVRRFTWASTVDAFRELYRSVARQGGVRIAERALAIAQGDSL